MKYLRIPEGGGGYETFCNPISQPTLTLPTKKGGLGVCHIAHKSLAMRANQINQLLQPNCKLPSTKFARHWMAKKIYFLKDWANFLSAYGPEPPETISQNKGYNSLITLFHNNQNIYISQKILPSSKQVYAQLQKGIKRPQGSEAWESKHFPTPAWENSFKALTLNYQQEKLWRLRHYKLYHFEAKICTQCGLRTTQEHVFATCAFAKGVMHKIFPIIKKINPPNLPRNNEHLILGVKGTTKRAVLVNTLISALIHHMWKNFLEIQLNNVPNTKTPQIIANLAIKDFQKAISDHFKIHTRNDSLEIFKEKIAIPEIASIRNNMLYFEPP